MRAINWMVRMKNPQDVMKKVIVVSTLMLLSAGVYDQLFDQNACLICYLQRLNLLFLIVLSSLGLLFRPKGWIPRGMVVCLFLGQLLNIRHLYVLFFPSKVNGCIPMDLLLALPFFKRMIELGRWLFTIGAECSQADGMMTYFLIMVLWIFYLGVYQMLKRSCFKKK